MTFSYLSLSSTMTRRELLIATHNQGKVRELNSLLADLPFQLRSLAEFPEVTEVEETGTTFEDNAVLKARFYRQQTGLCTLADDSGLEVDALNGAPGVRSARYLGSEATDAERMAWLLDELNKTGNHGRRARFVCSIALLFIDSDTPEIFTAICEGHIAYQPHGRHGFGYDPIFVPAGYTQTFGELSAEIKQKISHRARALAAARISLRAHFDTRA